LSLVSLRETAIPAKRDKDYSRIQFVTFRSFPNQTARNTKTFQGESEMKFLFSSRVLALVVLGCLLTGVGFAQDAHTTNEFRGVKVNGGTVTHSKQGDRSILTLSDDFKVPETPDPHWQVVDSKGNVYTLERLQAKNGKFNKSITLPPYIPNVTRVQIWCAFAETLLGEASFTSPVM
jgi:hypothetical protein